ncbi:hypothetical protein BP6252_06674 [Coleophoma cylindrospora]|uniref:Uncharacterized protein n=1 Tax=Coleophoma cylindrospora TaxID=1849047 RepID=A0A3D8RN60_9HELO|nr:hypothetical protein BP6252_06674 [Coleophoma cylindrospora]
MATFPTQVLAGVTVPDTPLITKALAYAREHVSHITYNHVMRSWLCGQVIANQIPHLKDRDVEAQALGTILHDLGWAETPELISSDKRFEVDGANAARAFLAREGTKEQWDKHRIQLVWDAIALHTTTSIAAHKEAEVQACMMGVMSDFLGPDQAFGSLIGRGVWEEIIKEYPRLGFKEGVKEVLCGLCKTKPETTYDNFVADFGETFVDGYSRDGKRGLDLIMATEA